MPVNSRDHWQRTQQGHAAANLTPVIVSNRIGTERALRRLAEEQDHTAQAAEKARYELTSGPATTDPGIKVWTKIVAVGLNYKDHAEEQGIRPAHAVEPGVHRH